MAVDDACDDDCEDRDTVRDFPKERRCSPISWRCNVSACVALYYDCNDQIHGYVNALKQVKRFGVGFGVFEFGYQEKNATCPRQRSVLVH